MSLSKIMGILAIMAIAPIATIQAYPLTALDWSNFKTQISSAPYSDTQNLIGPVTPQVSVTVTPSGATPTGSVAPALQPARSVSSTILSNNSPLIGLSMRYDDNSTLFYDVVYTATGTEPLLRTGDAIYFGEFLVASPTSYTEVVNFAATTTGGASANTSLIATNTNILTGGIPYSTSLIYSAIAGTITPDTSGATLQTGALFLQNTGPAIGSISFRVKPIFETATVGDLVLTGVAVAPEPTTYFILGGMLAFSFYAMRRKKIHSSKQA